MKKWKIHFIPQTHWDKEWYFTKYVSDIFLIDNIDKIYEIYQRDHDEFKNYTYDGQYSIVDDYLSYYPENEYKIKELVAMGKLILGPWYTQMDTINTTGESIVRNLLIGTKSTEKYGQSMHVGYIPDSFGFNANLPQIFKKANLKALVHWRGIYSNQIKHGVYNQWKGIDGTTIPVYNMFKWGYGVGVAASLDRYIEKWTIEDMEQQAQIYLKNLQVQVLPTLEKVSKNTNGLILLPFGSDQLPIYDGFKQWIAELNKIDPDHEWVLSDYDQFVDELLERNQTNQAKMNLLTGELRFGQYSRAHKTITSSRYDIKQLVRQAEYLIYDQTEPLAIMFEKYGGVYPKNIIEKNLKKLLESQAHDSLGGSNTDETNDTIVERLNAVINSLESLNTLMKRRIVEAANLTKNQLIVFNLKPYSQSLEKELWIYTDQPSFKLKNQQNKESNFSVLNQRHSNIANFIVYDQTHLKNSNYQVDDKGRWWTKILLKTEVISALSFAVYNVEELDQNFNFETINQNFIENDFQKIIFESDQSITWINKITNATIKNAFYLVSDFDAGDSYDYSPNAANPFKTEKLVSCDYQLENLNDVQQANLSYKFLVPETLDSKNNVEQLIELTLTMIADKLDLTFKVKNIASDIRWRLILNTPINATKSYADTSFGTISRPIHLKEMELWEQQQWDDMPIEIEAIESVVSLKDKTNNYHVYTKGNNEYQVLGTDHNQLALTLFRAYSAIGRRNLVTRPGRASGIDAYPHETLKANLHKPLTIKFRIVQNQSQAVVRNAKEWATDLEYYQVQTINQYHWKGDTFVMTKRPLPNIDNQQIIEPLVLNKNLVVSAFKKAELTNDYLIRVYNPTNKKISWKVPNNFFEVNLLEEDAKFNDENLIGINEVKTYLIKE